MAWLPGPRSAWLVAWALVPPLNAIANITLDLGGTSAVWDESRARVALNYAALSAAVVIAVAGSRTIARRLEGLRSAPGEVLDDEMRERFREVNSAAAPTVGALALALAFGAAALIDEGWPAAAIRGATWFVLGVALSTFLWVYACLQLAVERLGREHIRPERASVEPGLGLRPLGAAAATGLWLLLALLIPVLLTGVSDVTGVVIGVAVLTLGTTAFAFALLRLHRQMLGVKADELAIARELYLQAYSPIRAQPNLDVLDRQRALLGAADALEKRARAIDEWPIDEGTVARLITIVTSVIAVIVARLILDPFGL